MKGFSSISALVEDLRAGKMIILADDENRENEGDLVMAAEKVTPAAVNFMISRGRGLVCVPMTPERLTALGLIILALVLFITTIIMDFRFLYPLMIMAGAAFAIILVVAYSYFITIIPPENTAGFLGVYMACQNGAILIGPALGGYIVETFGPRTMYPCAGTLVLLGAAFFFTIRSTGRKGSPGEPQPISTVDAS